MKRNFRIIITIWVAWILSSCQSWLEVKPYDQLSEKQVFATTEGFRNALNGVYIELNSANLYGQQLTMTTVEYLANRFVVDDINVAPSVISKHWYDDDAAKAYFDAIWQKAYGLIANINVLLDNCESGRGNVLSEMNYGIIKGEAQAVRAMLHLDLFRLFGPMYPEGAEEETIPYNKKVSTVVVNYKGKEFMDHVLTDLKEARDLLKKYDPIIEKGPSINQDMYDNFRNRTYRMNYYAVETLLARAALYAGEKDSAYIAAKEVIAAQEKWFPFIKMTDIVGNVVSPDRIFSSEVLFALEHLRRWDNFKVAFNPEANNSMLSVISTWTQTLGYYGNPAGMSEWATDYRALPMFADSRVVGTTTNYICSKYAKVPTTDSLLNHTIPLIRISEAYYIAAECSTDEAERYDLMMTIRKNRGLNKPGAAYFKDNFEAYLTREYYREFLCEGQLFFYFKRKHLESIKTGDGMDASLSALQYVLPKAKSEIEY
ncbi:MAG: RagB/SusD family nutrient uptake outer membrane protein [Odoribacter sp.]